MSEDTRFKLPSIGDDDLDHVVNLLKLAPLDDPRRDFLKSMSTLDVAACPGSGKTTLIVAKLAILGRKWEGRTKGICVLSHTNVAREEIERRLGGTPTGQKLLSYPHFVGTIHGFINQFLAMPWLKSKGLPVAAIDNDICTRDRSRRFRAEGGSIYPLQQKHIEFSQIRIISKNMSIGIPGGRFPFGTQTDTYQKLQRAFRKSSQAGYFCYDEMFVWAKALLEEYSGTSLALRERFPIVFLDEMQDTSEEQSNLLGVIFPRHDDNIAVQRLGDPNQAIFESTSTSQNTGTDIFPDTDTSRVLSIPNSFRFGTSIAGFSNPIAFHPVKPSGLQGVGPMKFPDLDLSPNHAIILFSSDQVKTVLNAYGLHLLNVFPDEVIRNGKFVAVGAVHGEPPGLNPAHNHYPKGVVDYWNGYTPSKSRNDPVYGTFVECVLSQQMRATDGSTTKQGVSKIADALIRFADQIGTPHSIKGRSNKHRAIVMHLQGNQVCLDLYHDFLRRFIVMKENLTEQVWELVRTDIEQIAAALCTNSDTVDADFAREFLSWPTSPVDPEIRTGQYAVVAPNVYTVTKGDKMVKIDVGSIHSVKGQTHTATLVLETFRYKHSFEDLMPWIAGQKSSGAGVGPNTKSKLLQTYVAMTRPTHLVCLAIREQSLGNDAVARTNISNLQQQGWRVGRISDGTLAWI